MLIALDQNTSPGQHPVGIQLSQHNHVVVTLVLRYPATIPFEYVINVFQTDLTALSVIDDNLDTV